VNQRLVRQLVPASSATIHRAGSSHTQKRPVVAYVDIALPKNQRWIHRRRRGIYL